MAVGRSGDVHNLVKVLIKVFFSDNNSDFIDIWNINRYIHKVLHNTRIITLLRVLSKLFPLELGKSFVF